MLGCRNCMGCTAGAHVETMLYSGRSWGMACTGAWQWHLVAASWRCEPAVMFVMLVLAHQIYKRRSRVNGHWHVAWHGTVLMSALCPGCSGLCSSPIVLKCDRQLFNCVLLRDEQAFTCNFTLTTCGFRSSSWGCRRQCQQGIRRVAVGRREVRR